MNHIRLAPADRVRAIVAQMLSIEPESMRDDQTIIELGGDPLDAVEIAGELEEAFGIEVEIEQVDHPATIADLIALVGDGGADA